jgi:hypothetical protein
VDGDAAGDAGPNSPVSRLAVGLAAALALCVTSVVAARTLVPPDPQRQAEADGCERNDTTLHTLESPNWVRVNDNDYPANGPQPPLQLLSGRVRRDAFDVTPSDGDNPVSHAGYDVAFDVDVDDEYADLVAHTNTSGGIHVEREAQATPFFVWPEPGDAVTLKGYWTWDCDHFLPEGEETELHPITAFWVQRKSAPDTAIPTTEGDLFVTTEKTEAGKHADCAHKTKHDRAAFKTCVLAEPDHVDMGGNYQFALELARPRGAHGKLRVRVVDRGSVNAPRITVRTTNHFFVNVAFTIPHDGKRHVVAKQVFAGWSAPRAQHLRVSVTRVLIHRAMDPGCPPQPPGCGSKETTRDDQLTHGPTGEWNFYWDVAGLWSLWRPLVFNVRDGQRLRPHVSTDVWVQRGHPFRVLVWPRECDYGTLERGGSGALYPCPRQQEFGNRSGDDVPGGILFSFRSPARALGVHTANARLAGSTCPRSNKRGCYAVTIRVRRLPR